jgi:dienelactone hydrolase
MRSHASAFAGLLILQSWFSIPFLDEFTHREAAPALLEQSVQIDVGGRRIAGFLVTPAAAVRLPAVLLGSGRDGLSESLRRFAREIGGIGYVTLAIDYRGDDETAGSPLLRAINPPASSKDVRDVVDWLAAQPSVDAGRIGAVAWNAAFDSIAKLEESRNVRAYPTRLDSPAATTEQAWVDIYEFLGKYVEDAPTAGKAERPLAPEKPASGPEFVRIVDIMRVIMSDQGVRARLARSLTTAPSADAEWEQARSDAAMLAEAGNLLLAKSPPRGSVDAWRRRAEEFRSAAEVLLRAVEGRDFAAAQQSLRELPQACAACHADHR